MKVAPLQQFISKIRFELTDDELGECWLWTGSIMRNGYGRMCVGKWQLAHRLSYEWFVGSIPEGTEIDHLCRKVNCVNPRHLEAVTKSINSCRGMAPIHMGQVGRSWKGKKQPHSEAHIEKSRAVLDRVRPGKGYRHSDEARGKMVAARRAWWARKREGAA